MTRPASSQSTAQRVGFWVGLGLATLMLVLPAPSGLSPEGWRAAAVGVLMAVWWTTEAIPLAATSLVPLVAFSVLGVLPMDATSARYMHPLILLFLGGFLIARTMERWGLHRRIALAVIDAFGSTPRRVLIGFIAAAGLLSMGISNTATAVMMLPIAMSAAAAFSEALGERDDDRPLLDAPLLLAVAYACSVGGIGTLIGTPTNAILAGFLSETYGVEVSFAGWLVVGLPFAVLGLGAVYLVLTRLSFRIPASTPSAEFDAWLSAERARLGPPSAPQIRTGLVFGGVSLLWITRPLWQDVVPGASDTGIALLGSLVLFALPAREARGDRLLDWPTAVTIPWGVLLLFGGGLALAAAIDQTGLAGWIGERLGAIGTLPLVGVVAALVLLVVFLTELTSNTATAAAFLPVLAALPVSGDPLVLLVAATFAASCAFMLPVATPPNAIVYGSGKIEMREMMRAGLALNLVFAVLVTLWAAVVVPLAVGRALPTLP